MSEQKLSLRKRSLLLAKGAKATLKADKELIVFPILSSIIGGMIFLPLVALVYFTGKSSGSIFSETYTWESNPWVTIPAFIVGYIFITFVAHYFEAAVYNGAIQRFRGKDPTVSSSLKAVNKKFKPLLLFSLLMSTVGLALQFLENKLPFAGKIAVWLFHAAWSIANVFAVPYIMTSKQDVSPIKATRESVQLIKKVWGENVVASFSIGLLGLWWLLGATVLTGILGALLVTLQASTGIAIGITVAFFVLAISATITVIGTLTTIVKAAVFYYATTGESPEAFSKELLRATMTKKKSRKVFQV